MTPIFIDLEQEDEHRKIIVEKQHSVQVEVADGHLVDVPPPWISPPDPDQH
jgi:hypothetical protein